MEIIRNLILFVLGGAVLIMAVRSLRAHRLKERYAIIFVLTGIPLIGLSLWTNGVGYVSELLSIDYRTVSLVCVTFFFILMIFKLFSIVSVQERRITVLAQRVAILVQELQLQDPSISEEDYP